MPINFPWWPSREYTAPETNASAKASRSTSTNANASSQLVSLTADDKTRLIDSAHRSNYGIYLSFALGAAAGAAGTSIHRRYLKRYFKRLRTADWITADILAERRWIKGLVTSVGDADNFRLYHTPGVGWRWPVKFRSIPSTNKDLKDETIHIRIAGVDAPEGAHFGKPAQPFAEESLAWLRNRIEGRYVQCQLIRRDRYGRIVAVVSLPSRFLPLSLLRRSNLALEMLKAGCATTYEQAGAEYGRLSKEEFQTVEEAAKVARRGMWKDGVDGESPAAYKRRYAQAPAEGSLAKTRDVAEARNWSKGSSTITSIFRRIFGGWFKK